MTNDERTQTKPANMEIMAADLEADDSIDVIELLYRILANLKYVVLAAMIGALAAGVYTFFIVTPQYSSTAKLYVMSQGDSAINLSDLQIGAYLTNDYQEVFKTWEVHEMVTQNLDLNYSYSDMQSMLTVSNPKDTRILYITVTCDDARQATDIANEYANVARKYISETMSTEEPNVLSVALMPSSPVSPNKTRNIMIGFLLGAVAAVGVVVIRFMLDDKIRTADDIYKYANIPTLSVIPVVNSDNSQRNNPNVKKRRKAGAR